MKKKILLEYSPQSDACRWVEYLESGKPCLPAKTGGLDEFFAAFGGDVPPELVLVLNSTDINVKSIEFSASERRHILKTAPYELEESLVSDVDQLHFAFAKPGESQLSVAVVEREWLRALVERFEVHGLELAAVLPYAQVLQAVEDRWMASASADGITVRLNEAQSFTTSYEQARLAWDMAGRAVESLPQRITLFEDSPEVAEQVADTLPPGLASLVTAERKPWFVESNWLALKSNAIDLLQGEFSPSVAWNKVWGFWRAPVLFFVAGVSVYTLAAALENRSLEAENLALRQQTMAAYQKAFPNSQVSNPEQQMRSQLKKYSGTGESSEFMPLFYASAQALNEYQGLNVLNINFDARNNELRVDLVAKQFQDIEKIRSSLLEAGVNAQLVSSNSIDAGERARMKFTQRD